MIPMSREFSYMRFGKGTRQMALYTERKICKNGYAGVVFSPLLHESIRIFVNDRRLEDMAIRMGYISVLPDGTDPVIFLTTDAFYALKRGSRAMRFLLFHEIGHYVCGHLSRPPRAGDPNRRRFELVTRGLVCPDELEADRFAVTYLGRDYAIWALQEAMGERLCFDMRTGAFGDEISNGALAEFQMRIDAISDAAQTAA